MKAFATITLAAMLATSAAHATGPKDPPQQTTPIVKNWSNNQNTNVNKNQNNNRNTNVNSNRQGQAQGQAQGQNQSASSNSNATANNGGVNVNNSVRAAASSAYSADINGCGPAGGFSAGVQVLEWGVTAARCKADRFQQVIEAEERMLNGKSAAAQYLVRVDRNAADAFIGAGLAIDQRPGSRKKQTSSMVQYEPVQDSLWTVCEWQNGKPYIRVKAGVNVDQAVAQCMAMPGMKRK